MQRLTKLLLAIAMLVFVLAFAACERDEYANENGEINEYNYSENRNEPEEINMEETVVRHLRVAAVGDSTTFGSGSTNLELYSYPAVLAAKLAETENEYLTWEVMNFGVGGTTVQNAGLNAGQPAAYRNTPQFQNAIAFEPDIVLFMLGTNDAKTGNRDPGVEAFIQDYIELVNEFRNLPNAPRIYVMTPVALVETNLNQWLHEFISGTEYVADVVSAIKHFATAESLSLIDINEVTSHYPQFISDGVHPNNDGYRLIAETVFTVLYANYIEY